MARLIDANGIAGVSANLTGNYDYDRGYAAGAVRVLKAVENAPTIDAIPVVWMREKLIDHPELPYSLTDGINAVIAAWEDWQKEQEGNNGEVR